MNKLEKNVLITGSSGLIGIGLTELLIERGFNVRHLTSNQKKANSDVGNFYWNIEESYIEEEAFNNIDYLINLSGVSIASGLWTKKRKELIYNSRIVGTRLLFDTLINRKITLKGYFGASAIGYYGRNETDVPNEETDDFGEGFLARLCVDWEKEHANFQSISDNVSIGRISNVISKHGGLSVPYKLFSKFGLQIRLSNDSQQTAWISLADLTNVIFQLLTVPINGTFNLCTGVLAWGELQRKIYSSLGKQWLSIRIPPYLLKIVLREMASLTVFSSNVSNAKLKEASIILNTTSVQNAMI